MLKLSIDQLAIKVMAIARKKNVFFSKNYKFTQNLIMQ